jgi:AcrR family transcriptional regulator
MVIGTRKEREFERRESEILAVALKLFARDDWELVTVDEIAKKSDIGKGTIYKHFESKDEIYARLSLNFKRNLLMQIQQIDIKLSAVEYFREMVKLSWNAHLESKELHRVVLFCGRQEFRQNFPARLVAEFNAVDSATNKAIVNCITKGIEEGIFRSKPIDCLVFSVSSAFWGAIQIIWGGRIAESNKDQYCNELTNFMLAGLIN